MQTAWQTIGFARLFAFIGVSFLTFVFEDQGVAGERVPKKRKVAFLRATLH